MAQKLGYTNREAVSGKHIAMNMSLTNAIRMGLVVNPKLVSCAYSLKTDGSLDELKDKIDQIEDIQDRNEKLEEYEALRRNVENAEGIPEILQANVKKGGKYIVFLPVVEDLEDEDGNVIGRKKGKDKIADYEKQIAEYFKGSDIIPNFHSMLGEYGDKENSRRLEEFQNSNSEETEFMLVMNKANEGLHLDKLDGMIWLRPMDENSRILYLQQLGRVIYAEDPDNPTKDENRPVVIDLVNNTIKVNWENEITEQDDIQMLNLIVDWTERHDGTLPNINSSDKEETGYATVLKEVQGKYKGYLENGFEGLNEKQIEEVKEIVRLGSTIDLWQIDLPERTKRDGESKGRSFSDGRVGLFEVTGLLKDFVELEDEVDGRKKERSMSVFVRVCESLSKQGLEFDKFTFTKKVNENGMRKSIAKTLEDIQQEYPDIDITKVLEETGVDLNYSIGGLKQLAVQAINGTGRMPITEEERRKLIALKVARLDKESTMSTFVRVCESLSKQGFEFSKFKFTKVIEGNRGKKQISKTLEDIQQEYPDIDITRVLEETGVDLNYSIGVKKEIAVKAAKGKGTVPITEEDKRRLVALKVVSLDKESTMSTFVRVCESLSKQGFEFSKFKFTKSIVEKGKKKSLDKTLEDIQRESPNIDMTRVLEETGVDLNYSIGRVKHLAVQAVRGTGGGGTVIIEKEKRRLIELGVISLENRKRTSKEIAQASISSLTDIEMSDREDVALKELIEKIKEGGMNLDEQS